LGPRSLANGGNVTSTSRTRLTLGPNVTLGNALELLPALAWVRDPVSGELGTELGLGVVMNVPGVCGLLRRR
jgi:hypothetical protein